MAFDASVVTAFSDGHEEKLVADFVVGNARAAAAIKHALQFIPSSARKILDIGCGIGWSTHEYGRHFPEAQVTGIDLGPRLMDVAKRLTLAPNVRYRVEDVLDESRGTEGTFEAIVMLDVYQHIPVGRRQRLHGNLARLLGPAGVVILTCPTPEHQAYLRQHPPDGLQPVDEDVDETVVSALADDVGGRVVVCQHIRIWAPNDYLHVVIARPGAELSGRARPGATLLSRSERARLVEEQLRARVVGGKLVVPLRRDGPLVCIATPELDVVSETFIRNHIRRLPVPVCVVHGRPVLLDEENRPIAPQPGLLVRAARKIRRALGADSDGYQEGVHRALAGYFQRLCVAVVLAEYGTTGAELLWPCRIAGLPLVVHFHGYDAYQQSVIAGPMGRCYRELFEYAAAIVAVSKHMREQLVKLGAPAEKVHVIPYGVDTNLFAAADAATAEPRFLAVGRFVEKKAPHLLIVAMSRVVRACPEARLTMIGTGPLLPACRQLAAALGVGHVIDFMGARSHQVVAQQMIRARAFVQHSITASDGDSEGTPNSILEAQVGGLPVVATRHAGIVDCVADEQTGLLVDEQDVEGMADRMIRLVRDPEEAGALGKAARAAALERFPLEQSLARLAEVLRRAAS